MNATMRMVNTLLGKNIPQMMMAQHFTNTSTAPQIGIHKLSILKITIMVATNTPILVINIVLKLLNR
jgi:hypothetical protein